MSSITATKISYADTRPQRWWAHGAWRLTALFVLCYVVYLSVRQYFLHHGQPLDISRAQAVAFPLFSIFVYLIARLVAPVRLLLLLLFTSVGLFGVLYAYNYHLFAGSSFVVATLSDDPFASETRIFRKTIERKNRAVHGVGVVAYHATLGNTGEANGVLVDDARTKGVVWGNRRWLNVTIANTASSESIRNLMNQSFDDKVGALKIVTGVPWFGMSYKPVPESAEFLAGYFNGTPDMLAYAAQLQAPWTSYAHRGAAYLDLGNYSLKQSLRASRYNPVEMDCAIDSFNAGLGLVSSRDNHELRASLMNNLGTAIYIQGVFEQSKFLRQKGRHLIASAIKTPRNLKKGEYSSPKIAWENFQTIRNQTRKKGTEHDRR